MSKKQPQIILQKMEYPEFIQVPVYLSLFSLEPQYVSSDILATFAARLVFTLAKSDDVVEVVHQPFERSLQDLKSILQVAEDKDYSRVVESSIHKNANIRLLTNKLLKKPAARFQCHSPSLFEKIFREFWNKDYDHVFIREMEQKPIDPMQATCFFAEDTLWSLVPAQARCILISDWDWITITIVVPISNAKDTEHELVKAANNCGITVL